MTNNNVQAGGMGFLSWLTLAFIVLKLTDYITWSWWWVLSPVWIPLLVVIVLIILIKIVEKFL